MTNSINLKNPATNPVAKGPVEPTTGKKSLGQQDFLKLMVAQVKNQDPMQPQPNGEFLSQLAQFSTNDGITKMQGSLQQLASSLQSNQALQASALVGRKVMVNSNQLQLGNEGEVKAAMDVPPGLDNARAMVFSSSGELVKTIQLGRPNPGFFQFNWDGTGDNNQRLAAGGYKIEVHGTYEGAERSLKTLTSANVDSVSLGQNGEGLKLNVAGVGPITLDEVRQIMV